MKTNDRIYIIQIGPIRTLAFASLLAALIRKTDAWNLNNVKEIIPISILLILFFGGLNAQVVVQEGITIVDEKALTIYGKFSSAINGRTFQKDAMASHNGFQYLAYYDAKRHVCLARRELPSGKWKSIRFLDYYFDSNDAHNVVSLGLCPNDGTIHLAFDHHGHPLHYRKSVQGLASHPETIDWSVSSFGPVLPELEKDKPISLTYPKFWQSPDGNLQFNYRRGGSGSGDRMLVDYNAETGLWEHTRQIDSREGIFQDDIGQSDSRCSYPNGYDYDKDGKLHTTFVWRETPGSANHDLMYVYSEDKGFTWKNNAGKSLAEIPQLNSPGIVVQKIPQVLGLMNDHGQAIDSRNRVHVVMYHCTEESLKKAGSKPGETKWGPQEARRYFHYWRDMEGKWHHFEMDMQVGNRPKIFADRNDNLILIYRGADQNQHDDLNDKDLIIAVASAKNRWNDWHISHVVKGPFMNDILGDFYRWKSEEILSILLQEAPNEKRQPSKLKVVDLSFKLE